MSIAYLLPWVNAWVLPAWLTTLVLIVDNLIRVVALGVIPSNRRPSAAMAWLVLIMFVPVPGLLAYSLLGNNRLDWRRHRRQSVANQAVMDTMPALGTTSRVNEASDGRRKIIESIVNLNTNLTGLPATSGNQVELFDDYEETLAAMTRAVQRAELYVHLEFYIFVEDEWTRPLLDALADAVRRGISVRVLYDHIGSVQVKGHRSLRRRLARDGVDAHALLPVLPWRLRWRRPDLRNHRKILVVDGEIAYTGSQNLVEPGYHKRASRRLGRRWMDTMIQCRGPMVEELDLVFAADWYTETGVNLSLSHPSQEAVQGQGGVRAQIVPSGPGYTTENNLRLFTALIYSATSHVSVTSPYFVPDESLLYAMTTAAQRGIDVELFVNEKADQFLVDHAQRSYYQVLLQAGVKIWLYPAPYILHAKQFTIDEDIAVIGSSNMDMRSFALNYEVTVLMLGHTASRPIRHLQAQYRENSTELTLEVWDARPRLDRWVQNVARLTASLQ